MKLYHSTPVENLESIFERGLLLGGLRGGFVIYLSPSLERVYRVKGRAVLEVETGEARLSAFDDCVEWEVLCWGPIPPENLRLLEICE